MVEIKSTRTLTKTSIVIDACPLIALYEAGNKRAKAVKGFSDIEKASIECVILWPTVFEVRKNLSQRNVKHAKDFAEKFCPLNGNAKVAFNLQILTPAETYIYYAQQIVDQLNKNQSKPIVSDEDVLLAKYAHEKKLRIFTLDNRSFEILEGFFHIELIWRCTL